MLESPTVEVPIFIEVLLGAMILLVGVLTAFVAVAAIWGFSTIKQGARDIAAQTAQEKMDAFLKESNIRQMLKERVAAEANSLYNDMEQSPTHDDKMLTEQKEKEHA